MDKIVPDYYFKFGQYVNKLRALPSMDGLKPVERRVLLSAFKIAKNKFVKSAALDGFVTGNYHPHASCYGTIVTLVDQGWLDHQGAFKSNIGVRPEGPAAARYTECKFSNKFEKTFEMLKFVDWVEGEYPNVQEPVRVPFKFPLCLNGEGQLSQGMGFGYRSYFPKFRASDLLSRLFWLLKITKKEPVFAPLTECIVLTSKQKLKNLFTSSTPSIVVRGRIKYDRKEESIHLHSWPDMLKFESILKRLQSVTDVGYQDLSNKNQTDVVLKVVQKRKKHELTRKVLKKLIEVVTKRTRFYIYIYNGEQIEAMTIDKWLLSTYTFYVKTCERMFVSNLKDLQSKKKELQLLALVQKNIKKIDLNKNLNTCIKELSKLCNVSISEISELVSKHPIKSLMTVNSDTSKINKLIKEVENNLNHLDNYVLSSYKKGDI